MKHIMEEEFPPYLVTASSSQDVYMSLNTLDNVILLYMTDSCHESNNLACELKGNPKNLIPDLGMNDVSAVVIDGENPRCESARNSHMRKAQQKLGEVNYPVALPFKNGVLQEDYVISNIDDTISLQYVIRSCYKRPTFMDRIRSRFRRY